MGHRNRRVSFVDRLASGLVAGGRKRRTPGGIREYVRMPHEMVGDGDLRPPVIGETAEVRDDEVDMRGLCMPRSSTEDTSPMTSYSTGTENSRATSQSRG